jgi:hypothetical protein
MVRTKACVVVWSSSMFSYYVAACDAYSFDKHIEVAQDATPCVLGPTAGARTSCCPKCMDQHLGSWIQQKGSSGTKRAHWHQCFGHPPFNRECPPQGFMNLLSKNRNGKKRISQTVIQWQFFNICLSIIEKRKNVGVHMVLPPRGPLRTFEPMTAKRTKQSTQFFQPMMALLPHYKTGSGWLP